MPSGVYKRTKPAWNKGKKGYKLKMRVSKIGKHYSPRTEFTKGMTPWNKGIRTGIKTRGTTGMKHTIKWRKEMSERFRGCKSHLWRGGKTKKGALIRTSLKYRLWREAVFRRDGFQCIFGGKAHGNKLHADHIKPFAKFPRLRFDTKNGRTLCESCHKKTDSYLTKRKYALPST